MRREPSFLNPIASHLGGGGVRTHATETRGLLALKSALYSAGGKGLEDGGLVF